MAEIDDKVRRAEEQSDERDPFSSPYGPFPDCFSSNDIVRMYQLGALKRDVEHLGRCDACSVRIERFAQVMNQRAVARPVRPRLRDRLGWGRVPTPVGSYVMVHVPPPSPVVGARIGEPLRVQLLAGGAIQSLRNVKVRVGGAVAGEIAGWSAGDERFPVIELTNVTVSADVLDALRRHARVTEQVVIDVGESLDRPQVTAMANVEFTRGG